MCVVTLYRGEMAKKQVAARVPEDKHRQIRLAAARRDMDMASWLREAIDEKLEREGDEGNLKTAAVTAD